MMAGLNLWKTLIGLLMRFLRKFFDRKKNINILYLLIIFLIRNDKKTYKKIKKAVVSEANDKKYRTYS